jgi:hypothetical protein
LALYQQALIAIDLEVMIGFAIRASAGCIIFGGAGARMHGCAFSKT